MTAINIANKPTNTMLGDKVTATIFSLAQPQNKNVCQTVWHLYVDTVVHNSELYCYNTESNRNSVESQ